MASSGTHSYLNADAGLANTAAPGNFETGWSATWDAQLATTVGGWNVNLGCGSADQTWSNSPNSANENLPILCADWYEAYAFCIWDGGFLPSEAEWNYAAAGGSDQRAYPWSSPPTSLTIDCFHAICNGCGASNNVGSESPVGDGKWGHTDLAGNAFEWTLDAFGAYVTPCTDCAYLLAAPSGRSTRSASNCSPASWALSSYRTSLPATNRGLGFGGGCGTGLRCARAP